jgi:DNA-binding transcriptional regulator YhcF (GntR family)
MDFSKIDSKNYIPVYVQIKNIIKNAIRSGPLSAGDRIPSVREIAELAKVNPNTAAKALRELTLEGTLVSRRGHGYLVAPNMQIPTKSKVGDPHENTVNEASHEPQANKVRKQDSVASITQNHSAQTRHDTYVPEYVKVQNEILQKIASKELLPGDAIPAIREMAQVRNLNENTVAKAYRELQLRGVVSARRGVGYTIIQHQQVEDEVEYCADEPESPREPLDFARAASLEAEVQVQDPDSVSEDATGELAGANFEHEEVLTIVSRGEDATTEFKSTLRYDLRASEETGKVIHSGKIEKSVLKTIAAFLNSQGGTLLIGIADDGQAVGIELDGFPNSDKFLIHLFNIVRQQLGNMVAAQIGADCVTIGNSKTVCIVMCPPSPFPVYLNDKQGNEEFYVRMGPSSSALRPSEIHQYISHRFTA